jgi:hypothetical protein
MKVTVEDETGLLKGKHRRKLNRRCRRQEKQRLKYALQNFRELCGESRHGQEDEQETFSESPLEKVFEGSLGECQS